MSRETPHKKEGLVELDATSSRKKTVFWRSLFNYVREHPVILLPLLLVFLFCETSWQVYLAPTDVARYQCYALTFWLGSHATTLLPTAQCTFLMIPSTTSVAAFHLLPIEYPPLILLPFSLALLVPLPYYSQTFALLMLCVAGSIFWLLRRFGSSKESSYLFLLFLVLGACAIAQVRFDLLPALCTLICVLAAERKRWVTAYIALAFGVLFKLYPIVILPLLFIAEQQASKRFFGPSERLSSLNTPRLLWYTIQGVFHWQWRNCLLFCMIVCVVMGSFALLNYQEAIVSPLSYFIHRPVQIEASESSFLWLTHFLGSPYQINYDYGSLNILSALTSFIAFAGNVLLILGFLFVLWLQWSKQINLAQAMLALLLVVITTGKVFSPQYLIWVIPIIGYNGVTYSNISWLRCWGIVSVLTTFIYVFFYSRLPNPDTAPQILQSMSGFFEMVLLRNGFLIFTTLAYLFNWFQSRQVRM